MLLLLLLLLVRRECFGLHLRLRYRVVLMLLRYVLRRLAKLHQVLSWRSCVVKFLLLALNVELLLLFKCWADLRNCLILRYIWQLILLVKSRSIDEMDLQGAKKLSHLSVLLIIFFIVSDNFIEHLLLFELAQGVLLRRTASARLICKTRLAPSMWRVKFRRLKTSLSMP